MFGSYRSVGYSISGAQKKNVKAVKDSSVTIGCALDSSLQCAKVVSTANKVLSVIERTYVYERQSNIMYLYKSLIRTHLNTVVRPGIHTCKRTLIIL